MYIYLLAQLTSIFCLFFSWGTLLHPLVFAFPFTHAVIASMDSVTFHAGFSVNNSHTRFWYGREVFFLINYKCPHLLTLCSNYLQLLLLVDWQFPLFESWNLYHSNFWMQIIGKFYEDLTQLNIAVNDMWVHSL